MNTAIAILLCFIILYFWLVQIIFFPEWVRLEKRNKFQIIIRLIPIIGFLFFFFEMVLKDSLEKFISSLKDSWNN